MMSYTLSGRWGGGGGRKYRRSCAKATFVIEGGEGWEGGMVRDGWREGGKKGGRRGRGAGELGKGGAGERRVIYL